MRSSYRIPVHYVMLVIHSGPGLPLLIFPASGIQRLLYTCNIIPLLEKMLQDTLSHTDNYNMTPICSLFRKASFISWEINQASISWVTPISVKAVYQNFDRGSTSGVLAILPSWPWPVSDFRTIYSQNRLLEKNMAGPLPHNNHCSSCVQHFQTVGPTTRRSFCSIKLYFIGIGN